jgi:hypothetical protein
MKTRIVTALFLMIVLTGSIAFAEGSKTDCNCVKGGLGIPIGKFIIGFGYRTYSSALGCDTSIGLGLALGADTGRVQLGFGYNQGVIGLGFGVRGPETTTFSGFVVGYDYGDCRMVWPYEE